MFKFMENTFRDTNIAIANEMAIICDVMGINVDAIKAANYHPRVNIHMPWPVVGGHCLSSDPYFIVKMAKQKRIPAKLIETARKINEYMSNYVIKLVEEEIIKVRKSFYSTKIALLCVAYKECSRYKRNPSIALINELINEGAEVFAHDPYVSENIIISLGAESIEMHEALCCDCVILMTDHDQYYQITPEIVKSPIFICTRLFINFEDFKNSGIISRALEDFRMIIFSNDF